MRSVLWPLGVLSVLAVGAYGAFLIYGRMVEIWPYTVVERHGPIEVRDYPALRVAEVVTDGSRREGVRAGFGPLARYIFARERDGAKIAMTAPVTQEPAEVGGWRVRFVMPAGYTLEDLPAPVSSEVTLLETEPRRVAAVRFSGAWEDARFAAREAQLRAWLGERGLISDAPATYAYYNDPFTPGFLRRNEVLIALDPR